MGVWVCRERASSVCSTRLLCFGIVWWAGRGEKEGRKKKVPCACSVQLDVMGAVSTGTFPAPETSPVSLLLLLLVEPSPKTRPNTKAATTTRPIVVPMMAAFDGLHGCDFSGLKLQEFGGEDKAQPPGEAIIEASGELCTYLEAPLPFSKLYSGA